MLKTELMILACKNKNAVIGRKCTISYYTATKINLLQLAAN